MMSLWLIAPIGLLTWPFLSVIARVRNDPHCFIGPASAIDFVGSPFAALLSRLLGVFPQARDRARLGKRRASGGDIISTMGIMP